MIRLAAILTVLLAALAALATVSPAAAQARLALVPLPAGFKIELYARVPGARSMAVVDSLGVVFVGTRSDSVYAVIDRDRDGRAERVDRVLDGLKVANGIDWKDGWLYVAEQHRVVRFAASDLKTLVRAKPEILFEGLPDNPWHGWRYARFGPDGDIESAGSRAWRAPSSAWPRRGESRKSLPPACAIPSASISSPGPASFTSPTTAPT